MAQDLQCLAFVLACFFPGDDGQLGFVSGGAQVSYPFLRTKSGDCLVAGDGAVRLLLCFISALRWELLVLPAGGVWFPAVGCHADGGGRWFLMGWSGRMPMSVQRCRCGLVIPCRWLLRFNMSWSSSASSAGLGGRRRRAVAAHRRGDGGTFWKRGMLQRRACVPFCFFLFFSGCGCKMGMYCFTC